MTILLTGATGALGRALLPRLKESGVPRIRVLLHRNDLVDAEVEKVWGSLESPDRLAPAVWDVETVVHLAALTHSPREADYFRVNGEGTRNLLRASREAGIRRFVFVSSRAAHVDGGGYSRSKLEAEECVRDSGLAWSIIRVAEVYGEGFHEGVDRLVRWIRSLPVIPVPGTGEYTLSPVYVDDVIEALVRVAEGAMEKECAVIAGPEEMTFDELLDRLLRYLDRRKPRIHLPLGAVHLLARFSSLLGMNLLVPDQVPRLLCPKSSDISLAKSRIGFNPCRLEQGLNRYLK